MRIINREASISARRHGIATHEAIMWAKYGAKAIQMLRQPSDFPLPSEIAWHPT